MKLDPDQPYILTVEDVLTPGECRDLIRRIDEARPTIAPITTPSGFTVAPNIRNNERVMFDDPDLASLLLERVHHRAPRQVHGRELVGANERVRCYRYGAGMYFAPHQDGSFERDAQEQSFYSFLVYLNEDFEGGETAFVVVPEVKIKPSTGLGLLFQHPIVHEGCAVTHGVKYVARTDLMYRKPA